MIKSIFAKTENDKIFFIKALNKDCFFSKKEGKFLLSENVKNKYKIKEFSVYTTDIDKIKEIEENRIFKDRVIDLVDKSPNLKIVKKDDYVIEYEFDFVDEEGNSIYVDFTTNSFNKDLKIKEGIITLALSGISLFFEKLEKFGGDEGYSIVKNLKDFLEKAVSDKLINQVIEEDDLLEFFKNYDLIFNYQNFDDIRDVIKAAFINWENTDDDSYKSNNKQIKKAKKKGFKP